MSTRGVVRVKDEETRVSEILYSSSDSYPTGLGRDILGFVNKHPTAELGVLDYAMRMIREVVGLEHLTDWDDRAVDWVYDVCIRRSHGVELSAREVDWTDRVDGPQFERLRAPIDLSAVIAEHDAAADEYRRHMEKLRASIGNCPFCGLKGMPEFIPGGVIIKCARYSCRPRQPNVLYNDLDDAVAAWNRFVEQCRRTEKVEL